MRFKLLILFAFFVSLAGVQTPAMANWDGPRQYLADDEDEPGAPMDCVEMGSGWQCREDIP